MNRELLRVENLSVAYGDTQVVKGIDFSLRAGETLALVGESGSGKSQTAHALLRLLPGAARLGGSVRLDGEELLALSPQALLAIRGQRIGMVFQEPMTSLNPLQRIGRQVGEGLRLHRRLRGAALRGRVLELLELAGLEQPRRLLEAYPHQLSGGQRQRVMLAMALACEPQLLIADEPTTALDVTVQKRLLELLQSLQRRLGMATLLISHDLNLVRQVAALVGASAGQIVWTSGATESNNLALKGVAQALDAPGHLITSRLEHKAVLDTVQQLADDGWSVTWLAPGTDGLIRPEQVEAAWRADTRLVSLMRVNNELGTLTDIAAIGERVRERGALFHVDAAQASGKVAIDLGRLAVDLMSFSAHKTYGPKGIGALYVGPRAERRLKAQIHGGGHEQGLRSGTLATHQIVGMGEAFALAGELFEEEGRRIAGLQRRLLEGLAQIDGWRLNGSADARIAHTLNLTFDNPAFVPQALESSLAVSSTSACNSARPAPSHVLLALGHDAASAGRSVRLSLGRYTREADVDAAVAALKAAADSGAPAWQPFLGVSRAG
ncbi:TPA: aminotransferase class V-fold PLP-dependent enzyme [Pseudomonas aeruginosa]|nr:aminotransferase class V-fold PLP-dependent enzyme [Pseudomonas aeruginosa]